jgi:hypothetical protein
MIKFKMSEPNKVFKSDLKPRSIKRYNKQNTIVYNLKWYTPLIANGEKTGLLNHYKLEDLISHLVVCFTRPQKDYVQYLYYCFDSYIEFYHYQKKCKPQEMCFYEVVNFYQKPHFDIDIDLSDLNKVIEEQNNLKKLNDVGELLIETIIKGCKVILEPNILDLEKDVLIYTSHGLSKNNTEKFSCHIIINHWCHHDHVEAKAFFDLVYQYCEGQLKGQYVQFIDASVYKTNQNFRIVGSHKHNDCRVKVFQPHFKFNNDIINHSDLKNNNINIQNNNNIDIKNNSDKQNCYNLSKSLITFTSGCVLLQTFYICKPIIPYSYYITEEDLEEIKVLLHQQFGQLFKIRDIVSYKVFLKRQKPSHCPLCLRTHFHENPVIFVYKGSVQWSCRRRDDKKTLLLGFLSKTEQKDYIILPEEEPTDNLLIFGDYSIDLTKPINYDKINQDLNYIQHDQLDDKNNHFNNQLNGENNQLNNLNDKPLVNQLSQQHEQYNKRISARQVKKGISLKSLI